MSKYFFFSQNNSGGFDHVINGLKHLMIKASSAHEANAIAESMGIYFNGVSENRDCSCCGDRWARVYEDNALTLEEAQAQVESYASYGFQKVGFANL